MEINENTEQLTKRSVEKQKRTIEGPAADDADAADTEDSADD